MIPAATLYFADLVWNIARAVRMYNTTNYVPLLIVAVILFILLLGIIWLLRKPSAKPIIFLSLLNGFMYLGEAYNVISGRSVEIPFGAALVIGLALFFIWEFLLPLILAIRGLRLMQRA